MRPSDPRVRAALVPARWPLAGVLLTSGLGALLVIAQAFVVAGFVVALVAGGRLLPWAVAVSGVLAGRALVGLVGDLAATRAAILVGRRLRRRLLAALLVPGPRALGSGEAVALATRGVAAAEPYVTRYVPALVLAGVLPPLAVVAIATQDVLAAVIVLATLPLVPVFGALVGLATRDRAEEQWRAMAALSGHFLDVVRGLPTLVAYRRARAQSATILTVTHRYREAVGRTLRVAFASSAVLELVATLSVAVVAVIVGVRLAAGGLDLRTALVVLLLAPEAYWPLRKAGAEFHAAAEGAATFEAISALGVAPTAGEATTWPGDLVLTGVSVTHPERDRPALAALDARIPSRGVTAVVGPSGCGKSTLLRVVAGLLEPTSGSVTAGGRQLDPSWRRQVSWVPQAPTFRSTSVADNLRLARPDATDAELWAALGRVALADRVRALPGGLAAVVGEDARNLSAGERARLALARVIVADRPWVLLDEPTAHLDAATEEVIAGTITWLARSRAVVVVAHRDALVRLADEVIEIPGASAVVDVPVPASHVACRTASSEPATPSAEVDSGPSARTQLRRATVLGALASASGVALTATAGWLIVASAEHPPILTLLVAIVGVRAFGLARPVLRYVERLLAHDAALRLLAVRRVDVYDALVPLTPGALGRRRGDVLAAVVDDAESVLDRELRVRLPVRIAVLVGALAALVVGALEPAAGAVVLLVCLLSGLAYGMSWWGGGRAEHAAVQARAALSAEVAELLRSAEELAAWQAESDGLDRVDAVEADLATAVRRADGALAAARAWTVLLAGAGVVSVGLLAQGLPDPLHALVTLTPLALLDVLLPLADAGALARRTSAAERRLDELAARSPLVEDPAAPRPLPGGRDLVLDRVVAGWGGDPVLDGLSLRLAPGERLGVVGPSGCGKSTLAALLLRFLDPDGGRVSLGGSPLRELALDDVRSAVGLVDDEPHVFASTLAENVRFARPGATDQEVAEALRGAHLGPWLDALPDGIGTWVGDGHADLSGGERARLAVARVLLAVPDLVVLDEPTASLDAETAEGLAADVLDATRGRTVVWITHGRAGLDRMDRVLRMDRSA